MIGPADQVRLINISSIAMGRCRDDKSDQDRDKMQINCSHVAQGISMRCLLGACKITNDACHGCRSTRQLLLPIDCDNGM